MDKNDYFNFRANLVSEVRDATNRYLSYEQGHRGNHNKHTKSFQIYMDLSEEAQDALVFFFMNPENSLVKRVTALKDIKKHLSKMNAKMKKDRHLRKSVRYIYGEDPSEFMIAFKRESEEKILQMGIHPDSSAAQEKIGVDGIEKHIQHLVLRNVAPPKLDRSLNEKALFVLLKENIKFRNGGRVSDVPDMCVASVIVEVSNLISKSNLDPDDLASAPVNLNSRVGAFFKNKDSRNMSYLYERMKMFKTQHLLKPFLKKRDIKKPHGKRTARRKA